MKLGRAEEEAQLYRLLAENVVDYAIFVIDGDRKVRFWNPGAERLLGYSETEILGESADRFFTPEDREARAPEREVEQALQEGRGDDDRWHIRKDGSRFWSSGSLTPLYEGEALKGFAKIMRDRTDLKLEQERSRFQADLLDAVGQAVIATDPQGTILYWNVTAESLYGWSKSEAVGQNVGDLVVAPEAMSRASEIMDRLRSGKDWSGEFLVRRRDGSTFPVFVTDAPILDPDGTLRAIIGISANIEERLKADAALRESESRLRALLDNLPDGALYQVVQSDDGGTRFTFVSAGIEKLFGVKPERAVADPSALYGTIHEQDVKRVQAEEAESLRTLRRFDCEFRHLMPGGEVRWAHARSVPRRATDGRVVWEGILTDATERYRIDEERRTSEERFRGLMDQAPFSIQLLSADGRTLRVNRAWEELWGLRAEQVADYNILHDPQLEAKGVLPHLRRAFAGEPADLPEIAYDPNETIPDRTRYEDPVRWVSAVAYPIKDESGNVREVVLVHEDITARRRAEAAVRESEEWLRLALKAGRMGTWEWDVASGRIRWSEGLEAIHGLAAGSFDGTFESFQSLIHSEDLPEVKSTIAASLKTGAPYEIDFRFVRTDGTVGWMAGRGKAGYRPHGSPRRMVGVGMDVTERQEAVRALHEADRRKDEFLATLGHELRNPLAPLRTGLDLLSIAGDDRELARETLTMMDQQLGQMVHLIDDLLDVSRITRGVLRLRRERLDLASPIAAALDATRPLIQEAGHALEIELPSESMRLDGDATRLSQVFSNLLNNAAKYTERGGTIALTVHRKDAEAVIAIRDSGIGIAREHLERVFEKFSQVEAALDRSRGGLGIGLAIVRGIVELHGGSVAAFSEGPGKGSEFVVRLPLSYDLQVPANPRLI